MLPTATDIYPSGDQSLEVEVNRILGHVPQEVRVQTLLSPKHTGSQAWLLKVPLVLKCPLWKEYPELYDGSFWLYTCLTLGPIVWQEEPKLNCSAQPP